MAYARPPQVSIDYSDCVYSVSIDPRGLRPAQLEGHEWALRAFDHVLCFAGDGPLTERTAFITGRHATELERSVDELVDRITGCLLMSQLVARRDFDEALGEVQSARAANPSLAIAIAADARSFVTRVSRRGELAVSVQVAEQLSREYVELEIAAYLALAREGHTTDVYVGAELPVLLKFIDGQFPGVLRELEERVFISLKRGE